MKTYILLFSVFSISITCFSQNISSIELLNKTINYHDPNGAWNTFNGKLHVTMEASNKTKRDSNIEINLTDEYFTLTTKQDSVTYTLKKGICIISKKDSLRISKQIEKPKRSHCEMAELFKNYYTYLYGLPMKLKDPGTIINDKVEHKTFNGKDYLTLQVSYESSVGSDIWFFYFNPVNYAMEIYQFFKTDNAGKIKPDSGEYILLSDIKIVNGIKMPKIRAWYYNKNNKYLGTDILK
ncbi:aspartyl-tRNA synthetase [Pseudalgibacter alginicilyticus]|uniref:Aspartyl-tRNA synthetase n=1 Tax=Pseudalgibacter alginicilyticus TaxID=1736674 RepID=A0A0P0DB61_9FLAO|nr:DUF6503 family protein [Pseudalgibacter alginicilyticus]ALJ05317.1 aspartyl-tRNA synthetase [Pseudalgibacter alginicilyticus]